MVEKALLMVLIAVTLITGVTYVGHEVKHTFCEVAAAVGGGQARCE